jgi:hypothetical protein
MLLSPVQRNKTHHHIHVDTSQHITVTPYLNRNFNTDFEGGWKCRTSWRHITSQTEECVPERCVSGNVRMRPDGGTDADQLRVTLRFHCYRVHTHTTKNRLHPAYPQLPCIHAYDSAWLVSEWVTHGNHGARGGGGVSQETICHPIRTGSNSFVCVCVYARTQRHRWSLWETYETHVL